MRFLYIYMDTCLCVCVCVCHGATVCLILCDIHVYKHHRMYIYASGPGCLSKVCVCVSVCVCANVGVTFRKALRWMREHMETRKKRRGHWKEDRKRFRVLVRNANSIFNQSLTRRLWQTMPEPPRNMPEMAFPSMNSVDADDYAQMYMVSTSNASLF